MRERLSERLRAQAVERLQWGYASGALGTQTFEWRIEAALTAGTPAVLREVTSDLAPPSGWSRIRARLDRAPAEPPSSGLLAALVGSRPIVIGRSRSCDLVLSDDSVSRRHAMLVRHGDRVIVTDLGSTNGTLVNGRFVTQAEVQPCDHLQVGELDLLL